MLIRITLEFVWFECPVCLMQTFTLYRKILKKHSETSKSNHGQNFFFRYFLSLSSQHPSHSRGIQQDESWWL